MMQEDERFQRLLLEVASELGTQNERSLEVLVIEIATERLKRKSMLIKIHELEEYQRGYILEHPEVARTIQKAMKRHPFLIHF